MFIFHKTLSHIYVPTCGSLYKIRTASFLTSDAVLFILHKLAFFKVAILL